MSPRSVLLTGGTGTLGSLAAAALLRDTDVHIVAPVRSHHPPGAVAALVEPGLRGSEGDASPPWRTRLHQIVLPPGTDDPTVPDPLGQLDHIAREHGVDSVVHCAGCLSYFDEKKLRATNIEMTQRFVNAAARWGVDRFVHISTAFASGFVDGLIGEKLHDEPSEDPTFYTESKRRAEWIVAESGVPFIILRPSIVLGDSRDGRYSGPRYGLYQLWAALQRFLLDTWHDEIHYVAPHRQVPLLHQDAFQTGFIGAWQHLPDHAICHLTSQTAPTVREIADLSVRRHLRPNTVHYYDRLADVPLDSLSPAERSFLRLASTNVEISSRAWDFDTSTIEHLVELGTPFVNASTETVERCQQAYLNGSRRLADFRKKNATAFPAETAIVEHGDFNLSGAAASEPG